MESHVLNPTYHQTRFRPIGHKVLRLKSDSISSESSCNQNSPEYPQISGSRQQNSEYSNGDWCIQNQTINTTHSSQDSTSDEESSDAEENIKDSQMVEVQDHDEDSDEELEDSIEECEINVDDEGNVHQESTGLHPSPLHTMQHNVDDEDNVDHETDSIHSSPLHTMQHNFDDEDNLDQEAGSRHSSTLHTMQQNVDDEDNIDHETDSLHSSPLHTMQHKVDDEDNINHETDSIHSSSLYTMHHNVDDEDDVDHETDSIHSSPPHTMQHNFDEEDIVDEDAGSLHSSPRHTMHHNVDDDDNVDQEQHNGPSSIEDHTLVEGDDYEIITVYTVNPDMIEPSSEDDAEDYAISEKDVPVNSEDNAGYIDIHYNEKNCTPCQGGLDLNLDGPVVSNVDEYFITNNNNEHNILNSDEPVVKDVDEYFIKGKNIVKVPTFDDFFSKHPLPEEDSTQFKLPTSTAKVEHFLDANTNIAAQEKVKLESEPEQEPVPDTNIGDVSINESDLEILPNIEDIKRYLLDDIPYTKLRHNQKSCSVPQSPMQNLCMDIDDAKTSLSFEDLNLDLSDLTFESEKDKSASTNKSDDPPRTLTEEDVNSFLITDKPDDKKIKQEEDDFSPQDMEIESTIDTESTVIEMPSREMTSTPIPRVLDFCIEKTTIKKEIKDPKIELDDFVDVESCNDTVIPVLEANNVNSLLEQFEATEKLNTKKRPAPVVKIDSGKVKSFNKNSLTNGMRLQDAGVQLNKNKMRQILMPTPINSTIGRSKSPVYSDHDYCSSKKRHSLPNLKGGRSLLKPEVLSSNSRILNSRHRSCKSKKVVYHVSSDEETEDHKSKNKKVKQSDDIDPKKKTSIKTSIKPPVQSNCRKKLSLPHSAPDCDKTKNSSVMINNACKASDTNSQNSNGSIRLTIKNKSEVILNCDHIDSQKVKVDNCKNRISDQTNNLEIKDKNIKELDRNKSKVISNIDTVTVKEEPRPKNENFYTTLFSNKQDVQIPQVLQPKIEKRPFDHELNKCVEADVKTEEQPQKRKKLNLQEYKLRRGVCSNNSSAQVSPEAIFPDMPSPGLDKAVKCPIIRTPPSSLLNSTDKVNNEQKFFDPIKEASRKILMNTKKQKAEAMRKRDEDIVMSKIPKVENLQLQPLMTEAEMMKIVGMTPSEMITVPIVKEKPQLPADYEEIILVSIGINTEENMFQKPKICVHEENKEKSPPIDAKSLINFKIKKSDHILKQNVFDCVKRDKRSPLDEKRHTDTKIDKERYKDITATLKSVEKQVDTKISSNSLFASIQDVVMKKAPEKNDARHLNLRSPVEKRDFFTTTTIVRDYDPKAEHGEDKVILHLGKHRCKPTFSSAAVQTNSIPEFAMMASSQTKVPASRRRNDSDMSLSSDGSPVRTKEIPKDQKQRKSNERVLKPKDVRTERVEIDSKEKKRSRSKDRSFRRRSRSVSRGRRRRSRSRSISRSRGRYRRYKRSHSPYKRKRRSRSPYHKRRSPSVRRERSKFSRSRSRSPRLTRPEARSKTPMMKSKQAPHTNGVEKTAPKSLTPPLRKSTVSESSDSSSSSASSTSSSSTSSSASSDSRHSKRSCSSYNRDETYKRQGYRSYSSEDRESNTPVEERRIVFVGRLEKDITKAHLRNLFSKFGAVMEVRLHSKEDGSRYGFVTYQRARDAWSAVEAASTFPQYDVGFGGRRAFCRQSYADLDGLEAKYTESAFHGAAALPVRRNDDMSFEQMLLEMKKKLSQRKIDKKRED